MKRLLPITLAGLLVGGCGSMAKQSPGELVAQRVPPEPAAAPPAQGSADDGNPSAEERQPLDELLPDSAQVCIPAHLVQVQLRGGQPAAVTTGAPRVEAIGRQQGATDAGGQNDESAELERLRGLAQQLLADRK
jgi:hypothetical protein